MLFETEHFRINTVSETDASILADIYNGNPSFLQAHTVHTAVSDVWVKNELSEMKNAGFQSTVIFDKITGNAAGLMDYQMGEEVYLSLLMLRKKDQKSGSGKEVYTGFEQYAKKNGAKTIRIDVVYGYPSSALKFWEKMGFCKQEQLLLKWDEKTSEAFLMRKNLI